MRRMMRSRLRDDEGTVAVVVAMTMTVVLIVVALVVDVGAAAARRAQLQDAVDASALALAQRCWASFATNELNGCDPAVQGQAATIAATLIDGTSGVGDAEVTAISFELHTVTVTLRDTRPAFFAWATDDAGGDIHVTASAEWRQPAIALPLAVNACNVPAPSSTTAFVSTGVYSGLSNLLGSITAILGGAQLPDYLGGVVNCGTDVLAGGWLSLPNDDCTFDPNLVTLLGSTLTKVLPLNSCQDLIEGLIGKRVIVPVYTSATINAVGSILGTTTISHFAEIVVTGYDFDGILGIGDLTSYPYGTSPSCAATVSDFLGVEVGPLLEALLGWLFAEVLSVVLACQGIQGQVIDDQLTAAEAAALMMPYRLIS